MAHLEKISRTSLAITNQDANYISVASSLATLSDYTKRVGAVLVKNGNVVAVASNHVTNEGKHIPLSNRTIHAEEAVLLMVSPSVAKGSTIYIARIGPNRTDFLDSFPCERRCLPALQEAGVRKVVFIAKNIIRKVRI